MLLGLDGFELLELRLIDGEIEVSVETTAVGTTRTCGVSLKSTAGTALTDVVKGAVKATS